MLNQGPYLLYKTLHFPTVIACSWSSERLIAIKKCAFIWCSIFFFVGMLVFRTRIKHFGGLQLFHQVLLPFMRTLKPWTNHGMLLDLVPTPTLVWRRSRKLRWFITMDIWSHGWILHWISTETSGQSMWTITCHSSRCAILGINTWRNLWNHCTWRNNSVLGNL